MEDVTMQELAKLYTELGALGLICIVMIVTMIILIKNTVSTNRKNQEFFKKILEEEQDQNAELIKEIVNQVTHHTPSKEETNKMMDVSNEIDKQLDLFMRTEHASRVALIQYHNGSHSLNKQSFLRMTCTNEAHRPEEQPLTPIFHDQMRSLFGKAISVLDKEGYFNVEKLEDIKNIDESMYFFMTERGDEQAFHVALYNTQGLAIGYIVVIYSKRSPHRAEAHLTDRLKSLSGIIEYLLQQH